MNDLEILKQKLKIYRDINFSNITIEKLEEKIKLNKEIDGIDNFFTQTFTLLSIECTNFHRACMFCNIDLFKYILDYIDKNNPNAHYIIDSNGETPFTYCCWNSSSYEVFSLYFNYVIEKDVSILFAKDYTTRNEFDALFENFFISIEHNSLRFSINKYQKNTYKYLKYIVNNLPEILMYTNKTNNEMQILKVISYFKSDKTLDDNKYFIKIKKLIYSFIVNSNLKHDIIDKLKNYHRENLTISSEILNEIEDIIRSSCRVKSAIEYN